MMQDGLTLVMSKEDIMGLLIISVIVVACFLFVPFAFLSFVVRFVKGRWAGWNKVVTGGKCKPTSIED